MTRCLATPVLPEPSAAVAGAPPSMTDAPMPSQQSLPGLGAGGLVLLAAGITGNMIFGASTLALAPLQRDLDISASMGTLVVALFSTGFAASLVLGGRLGDAWGRRRVLRLALAALIPASVVAALAPGASVLLVGRAAQGVASGIALPQVLSTIQGTTTGRARTLWTGAYAAVVGGGTALGQIGAGVLIATDPLRAGWRLSLALVVVVALIVLGASGAIPETRSTVTGGLDLVGALLLGAAIAALVLPLGLSSVLSAGPRALLLLGALILLLTLALWEHRRSPEHALLPPVALRVRPLQLGLAATLVFFAGYGGFTYYLTITLQTGLHLGALAAVAVFMPFFGAFIVMSLVVPRLVEHIPSRRVMLGGAVAQAVLLAALALLAHRSVAGGSLTVMCLALTLLGAAQAAMYGPLVSRVMGAVEPGLAGLASGLFSTVQQVGFALGVPVFGLVLGAVPADPALGFTACIGGQIVLAAAFATLVRILPTASRSH